MWSLAFDSPGNLSPGLQNGAVGNAYPVQAGLATILYVTVLFLDAADSTIVIDILLNGNSIFDGSKIRYEPGDTGSTKIYSNLVLTQLKQNDQLLLTVLAHGGLAPGKNGTVIMQIAEHA